MAWTVHVGRLWIRWQHIGAKYWRPIFWFPVSSWVAWSRWGGRSGGAYAVEFRKLLISIRQKEEHTDD